MIAWLKKLWVHNRLRRRMPRLQGRVLWTEPLARHTWLGVGGAAEVFVEPADIADLTRLMKAFPDEPLTVLGAGSNVLVLDGGVPGITVHLGRSFAKIQVRNNRLICGSGALMTDIARVAEKHQITGFEFLSGIPGSIGGGVRMNAGAFGNAVSDRLVGLKAMTGNGDVAEIDAKSMSLFAYRKCCLPDDWIFLEVTLEGKKTTRPEKIRAKMIEFKKKREAAQPQGVRTAGSTFKNPDGLMAWQLIDKSGLKGCRVGGAVVSTQHANFIINDKNATAQDIEALCDKIRRRVRKDHGVRLELEIKKVGVRR